MATGPQYREALLHAAGRLLAIGEDRYRVNSSSADADAAWSGILKQLFEPNRPAA
jgi:hypothetical protein